MASDRLFFTGPMAFHSFCSRRISAAVLLPVGRRRRTPRRPGTALPSSRSSRSRALLRLARSSWRLVKKRSQAARNRSQIAFSCPRVTGPMVFHSACSPLMASAVCEPVGRIGERLGALAEGRFLREVLGAHARLRGEVRFAPRPQLVVDRLEPAPQGLALRARHVGRLAPLLLQFADAACHGFRIVDRPQRLHLFAELFLDPDVRPLLPLGDFAQVLDLGRQRRLRGLQPLHDLVVVVPRRQRRDVGERRSAHRASTRVADLEREVRLLDQCVGASEQLVEAVEAVAAIPRFGLVGLATALRLAGRLGLGPARVASAAACSAAACWTASSAARSASSAACARSAPARFAFLEQPAPLRRRARLQRARLSLRSALPLASRPHL